MAVSPTAASAGKTRRIYLRADDFGATPGANEAIIDGVACGTLRNVGLLAVGNHLDHCLDGLIQRSEGIALGLHAAIHCEAPALAFAPAAPPDAIPSLLDEDGRLFPGPSRSRSHPDPDELTVELEAQLALLRERGLSPSYLDTHMGFEWLPGLSEALHDFCREHALCFVREGPFRKLSWSPDLDWSRLSADALAKLAATHARDGSVWISHPAYADALSEKAYGAEAAARRYREARRLIDPDFVKALREAPATFERFPAPGPTPLG